MEHIHLYEEPEFDAETQERLDSQVDKLLKGYDWTLAPLANKYVIPHSLDRAQHKQLNFPKIRRNFYDFHLVSDRREWKL